MMILLSHKDQSHSMIPSQSGDCASNGCNTCYYGINNQASIR